MEYIFCFLLVLSLNSSGQIVLEGKITDEKSNPLPFASIGLINKPIGTVANDEGFFKLTLNVSFNMDTIRVSYMGYKSENFSIQTIKNQPLIIKLEGAPIVLDEVTITTISAKSMFLDVIKKMKDNYSFDPATYHLYTSKEIFVGKLPMSIIEAAVDMSKTNSKVDYELIKLRGRASSNKFQHVLDKSRTSWIIAMEYILIEKRTNWAMSKSEMRSYDYEFDSVIVDDGRLLQIINAAPKTKRKKNRFKYYIDIESLAIVQIHKVGEGGVKIIL